MADSLLSPPVLSTPAEHILQDPTPSVAIPTSHTEDELFGIYEISRTAASLSSGQWSRIALQFPDSMLPDAPWVVGALTRELSSIRAKEAVETTNTTTPSRPPLSSTPTSATSSQAPPKPQPPPEPRLYILADTSYSSCCVDEIAAEHVSADVIVHYGRACLSPTARLPVIYVFTRHHLDLSAAVAGFESEVADKDASAVVMADVTYQDHVPALCSRLRERGYRNVLETAVVHNPKGKLPNRKIISPTSAGGQGEGEDISNALDLSHHAIFHVAIPPTALLLALSSRVKSLHILPVSPSSETPPTAGGTRTLLGRRYARVLTLATAGIIGILINTLSVRNYLPVVEKLKSRIAAAGKKSYTVVVGKLNPAKLANFAEVDGWVVVGCWESGLVEGEEFYKPVITPFELDVALTDERERVWGGEWWAGIEGVEEWEETLKDGGRRTDLGSPGGVEGDEDEDEPPEFDLRTGKLVSKSRPMRTPAPRTTTTETGALTAADQGPARSLVMRTKGEVATIRGTISPGAEYLRTQRTWTGLGSDYTEEVSTVVEEGRGGIARGYTVGEEEDKR